MLLLFILKCVWNQTLMWCSQWCGQFRVKLFYCLTCFPSFVHFVYFVRRRNEWRKNVKLFHIKHVQSFKLKKIQICQKKNKFKKMRNNKQNERKEKQRENFVFRMLNNEHLQVYSRWKIGFNQLDQLFDYNSVAFHLKKERIWIFCLLFKFKFSKQLNMWKVHLIYTLVYVKLVS